MAKRKVTFADDDDDEFTNELEEERENEGGNYAFGKKFKRTLDSDEEDDEEEAQNYNVLDVENLGGQEEKTLEYDDDIKITPFNMNEELEEGHFDKEGTYIFHKEEEIRDNWLDNIDWVQIKGTVSDEKKNQEKEDEMEKEINIDDCYKQIVEMILPGETIEKAIQRIGKSCGKTKNSDRWKNKQNNPKSTSTDESFIKAEKEKLLKLSSLADKVLQTGDMSVYQKTYEQLMFHLNSKSKSNQNNDTQDDMFSDDFDSNKKAEQNKTTESNETNNEVFWEYKWEDTDGAQIYGPYSSKDMLNWVKEGYFEKGVYVRQIGKQDSNFYSSRRIDFDLYT